MPSHHLATYHLPPPCLPRITWHLRALLLLAVLAASRSFDVGLEAAGLEAAGDAVASGGGEAYAEFADAKGFATMSRKPARVGSVKEMPSKSSGGRGWCSCFRRKGSASANVDSATSSTKAESHTIILSKATFHIVTLLALTFGISYAILDFHWSYRSIATGIAVSAKACSL